MRRRRPAVARSTEPSAAIERRCRRCSSLGHVRRLVIVTAALHQPVGGKSRARAIAPDRRHALDCSRRAIEWRVHFKLSVAEIIKGGGAIYNFSLWITANFPQFSAAWNHTDVVTRACRRAGMPRKHAWKPLWRTGSAEMASVVYNSPPKPLERRKSVRPTRL